MTEFADRLKRLPKDKQMELIRNLLSHKKESIAEEVLVERSETKQLNIPSYQQEQLWLVNKLAGGKAHNAITSLFRFKGPLDVDVLQRVLNRIVEKHEILRTNYKEEHGKLYQYINHYQQFALPVDDLTGMVRDEATLEAELRTKRCATAFFDLENDILFRVKLFKVSLDEHILMWVVHHIAWDAWSTSVFINEIRDTYLSMSEQSSACELSVLPNQYSDFARWQRKMIKGEQLESLSSFWSEYLKGSSPTEIPSDFTRPLINTSQGNRITRTIDRQVANKIRRLGAQEGCTLFMVLLATFKVLLRTYSGSEDIVVGIPSANRPRKEIEPLLGFFVNMIAIRTSLAQEPTFLALLQRVKEATLRSLEHQLLPFEKVVQTINPMRDASRNPIFQIEFTNELVGDATLPSIKGMDVQHQFIHDGGARFDLSMITFDSAGELQITLEYNTALYSFDSINRILANYACLLSEIAESPNKAIADFRVISKDEEATILTWGNGGAKLVPDCTINELFEKQVRDNPSKVAVALSDASISYIDLNRRANQMANYLRTKGVMPNDRVGIYLERSIDMIVAVFAILKSGCAYVPIDPMHGDQRQAQIVAESNLCLLLTKTAFVENLLNLEIKVLCIDSEANNISQCKYENLPRLSSPSDLAYILFTSGSTGKPRGVMIEQRSVISFCLSICSSYEITSSDRVIQFASLAFDVSVFDIFSALLSGATLYVATEMERHSPELLTKLMQNTEITVAELPPSILPYLSPNDFPKLRLLSVGGEAPAGKLVAQWANSSRKFINGYGPTEATVAVSLMDCQGHWEKSPPIGRPMKNHNLYVLDSKLNILPINVAGELHIEGIGLARGYFNDPEATSSKFIKNPFSGNNANRLYKTGDMVRWLPGGDLEFLGRLDSQVKIRGHRVELGEVESVLNSYLDIDQSVAVLKTGENGDVLLIAYIVCSKQVDIWDVTKFISGKLPRYMVPSRVIQVDSIPLLGSGKVDYTSLPDVVCSEEDYITPRNAIEEKIVDEIFKPILKIERIGVTTSFFELGGNSLEATQIVSRMQVDMGTEIDLIEFFRDPTVAHLAELVQHGQNISKNRDDEILHIVTFLENISEHDAVALLGGLNANE